MPDSGRRREPAPVQPRAQTLSRCDDGAAALHLERAEALDDGAVVLFGEDAAGQCEDHGSLPPRVTALMRHVALSVVRDRGQGAGFAVGGTLEVRAHERQKFALGLVFHGHGAGEDRILAPGPRRESREEHAFLVLLVVTVDALLEEGEQPLEGLDIEFPSPPELP